MGYYYTLIGLTDQQMKAIFAFIKEQNFDFCWGIRENNELCKYYEWDTDCSILSHHFPDWLITLKGREEDLDYDWQAFFLNGQYYMESYHPPEFDLTQHPTYKEFLPRHLLLKQLETHPGYPYPVDLTDRIAQYLKLAYGFPLAESQQTDSVPQEFHQDMHQVDVFLIDHPTIL